MARVTISLTPQGVDAVGFLGDRTTGLCFYLLIERDLREFEARIRELAKARADLHLDDPEDGDGGT